MAGEIRCCAGGIVFKDGKVFLLKYAEGDWEMPKGVIREHNPSNAVALWRVEDEAGIQAEIIGIAGNTSYEQYSRTRETNVLNRIQWFAMRAENDVFHVNSDQGFAEGRYVTVEQAMELLVRPMDREVLKRAEAIYAAQAE